MNVQFLPAARAELLDAIRWYLEDGGPVPAELFGAAVRRATGMLCQMPLMGNPIRDGLRAWSLRRFPYTLVYRQLGGDGIEVIAVAHQRRQQSYWKSRV